MNHMPRPRAAAKSLVARITAVGILMIGAVSSGVSAQTFSSSVDQLIGRACTNACEQVNQKLAVDSAGNAFAIWQERVTLYENRVYTARYDALTAKWGTPRAVESIQATAPDIAFDGSGNALAVWTVFDEGANIIRYSRYLASQGIWTTPADAGGGPYFGPRIAMAKNGDALIHLTGRNYDGAILRFNGTTGTWSSVEQEATPRTKVAVDNNGNGLLATGQEDAEFAAIYIKRFDAATKTYTAGFSIDEDQDRDPATGFTTSTTFVNLLAVSKDAYGNEMLLWEKAVTSDSTGKTTRELKSARYQPSKGTWVIKPIPKISSSQTLDAALTTDRAANVHAVWTQYVGGYAKTVSSRYSSSTGAWSTPRVLSVGSFHTRDANIVSDSSGNVTATWSQRTDTGIGSSTGKIFRTTAVRFAASSGTWGMPSTIQDADRLGYRSYVGVDGRGRALVMWTQQSGQVVNDVPVKELRSDRLIPQ